MRYNKDQKDYAHRWRVNEMASLKEHLKTVIQLNCIALGAMYIGNRFIASVAGGKNMLKPGSGKYYRWQYGDVFYTKQGEGSPLLLIHELDPSFSSYEWNEIIDNLSKTYTVYAVDLPGCGRSFKDNVSYTNYYYVLFVQDFIRNVIKGKCTVIAGGYSSSFVIMANLADERLIKKIIAVNPQSLHELMQSASRKSRAAKALLSLPILGTAVYNIVEARQNIDLSFTEKYLFNPFYSKPRFVDAFYEGAHYEESKGKFLLASKAGKFMTVNIVKGLQKAGNHLVILYGEHLENGEQIVKTYQHINPSIKALSISKAKEMPEMECPEEFIKVFEASLRI